MATGKDSSVSMPGTKAHRLAEAARQSGQRVLGAALADGDLPGMRQTPIGSISPQHGAAGDELYLSSTSSMYQNICNGFRAKPSTLARVART